VAGHARYTAVLDACVLYPVTIANALLSLATSTLFAAKWTREIEQEWLNALTSNRPDIERARLDRRRDMMRSAVPDWEVEQRSYGVLVPALTLPDPGDRHVLAAAIAGHADCIVTANVRDFPAAILDAYNIEVIHPDDFVVMQLEMDTVIGLAALKTMRMRYLNPALSPEEFADLFERVGLLASSEKIREASALI
jgi:predicted nucleic acid-binding protein